MILILLAMALILALAALVAGYVAYPRRGAPLPVLAGLGEAMQRGVGRLPTLDNQRAWLDDRRG